MDYESRTELRLEPSSLRRHNLTRISDVHNLLHRNRIESESCTHFTAIHTALQFAKTSETTYEIYALRTAEVTEVEDVLKDKAAGDIYVENADRVVIIVRTFLCNERPPFSVKIERELMSLLWAILLSPLLLYDEVLCELLDELL